MQIKKLTQNYLNKNSTYLVNSYIRFWQNTPWEKLKDNNFKEYFQDFYNHGQSFLAFDNNKLIGLICGLLNSYQKPKNQYEKNLHEKIIKGHKNYATIDELVIDKNYRNIKLGRKLMKKYLNKLYEKKVEIVFLYTDNRSTSHNFYQNQGFKKIGKINKIPKKHMDTGYEYRVYYYRNL